MSKTVIRNKNGDITHIKVGHKTFLSKTDKLTFDNHTVTPLDIRGHYGDDDRNVLKAELLLIVNNDYDINIMKFDIMKSNDYFKDKVLIESYEEN